MIFEQGDFSSRVAGKSAARFGRGPVCDRRAGSSKTRGVVSAECETSFGSGCGYAGGAEAEFCSGALAAAPCGRLRGWTRVREGEADLRQGWAILSTDNKRMRPRGQGGTISVGARGGGFRRAIAERFRHVKRMKILEGSSAVSRQEKRFIRLIRDGSLAQEEAYTMKVSPEVIEIGASQDVGFARALVELEHRMAERGAPYLAATAETNSPSFSPRYVFSYMSLLTDVLGQDQVDPFPDGYLNELFHQDADGIWVYTLLQDLVPSPVFPEIPSTGSTERLKRLRDLVNRAAKHGLKVYIYLNEPRAQPLAFFSKHPDLKGHVEGNTAALCTSTEAVQKHLRLSFEKVFREVPGLGGVFVITASENLANCYSHTAAPGCARCSKRPGAEVIAESIRCMAEGVWAADPKAKFIVWDWSWHSVLGEAAPEQIIAKLPRGVALMADFERGTQINRGGLAVKVEEYSISVVGPSPRAKVRSEQAKKYGFDYLAKIQLSTTWECGTVPFIPVPNLLARKAKAMADVGVQGTMATWTIGSYPSPNTEAFAIRNWNPAFTEKEILERIALRRYGAASVAEAVAGWTKLSDAFAEEYPFPLAPYAGPLQQGPSIPLYRHDIPTPYGKATLLNCKDDWQHWSPPYPPDMMTKLLRHLCDRWDEGVGDLRSACAKAAPCGELLQSRTSG